MRSIMSILHPLQYNNVGDSSGKFVCTKIISRAARRTSVDRGPYMLAQVLFLNLLGLHANFSVLLCVLSSLLLCGGEKPAPTTTIHAGPIYPHPSARSPKLLYDCCRYATLTTAQS